MGRNQNPKELCKVFEDMKDSFPLLQGKDQSGSGDSAVDVLKKWANEIGGQNGLFLDAINYLQKKGDHPEVNCLVKKPNSKRKPAETKTHQNIHSNFFKQLNSEEEGVIKFLLQKQTLLERELKSCLDSIRPSHQTEIKRLTDKTGRIEPENEVELQNLSLKKSLSTMKNAILTLKNRTPIKQCRKKLNPNVDPEPYKELEFVVKNHKKRACSESANEFHLHMLEDLKNEINSFNDEVKKAEDLKKVIKNQEFFKKQLQNLEEKMSRDKRAWLKERKMLEMSFKSKSKLSTVNQPTVKKSKKKKTKSSQQKVKQDLKLSMLLESLEKCIGKQQEEIFKTRKEVEKLKVLVKKINEFILNQEKRSKELPDVSKEISKNQRVDSEINHAQEKDDKNAKMPSLQEIININDNKKNEPPLDVSKDKINKDIITLNIDKEEMVFLLSEKDPASCLINYRNSVPQISQEIEMQRQLMEQAILEEQQIHEMFESSRQKLYEMKTVSKRFKSH